MEHGNQTETATSSMLPADLAQVMIFSCLILIGLPVNISTLVYMLRRYRHAKSFLLLLHINLNISDILVLGIYVPGLVGWLISYEWLAGAGMCKFMRFFDAFVFAISSNIMVCIAVYRLCALRHPLWISAVGHSRIPRMVVMAWGIAAIAMSPQLFIWNQVELPDFRQCLSIWAEKIVTRQEMTDDDFWWMKFYTVVNNAIIFYIPVVVLIICYVLILKDIYKTLNNEEGSSAMYMSEISKLSTCGRNKEHSHERRKEKESFVSIRTLRGQDKFRRAKVRSLRITLMLILTYVITWLPYNLLCWWLLLSFDTYKDYQDDTYPLTILVVVNSVINPFIYGRCQGLKLLCSWRKTNKKQKSGCRMFR